MVSIGHDDGLHDSTYDDDTDSAVNGAGKQVALLRYVLQSELDASLQSCHARVKICLYWMGFVGCLKGVGKEHASTPKGT